MGAGILPICILNSQILFLFGKDSKNNNWSDFGGRSENNESDFDTAIREGVEELNGFLGDILTLHNLVKKNNLLTIHYDKYKIFIFLINYDINLPTYFVNNNNFITSKLQNIKFNNSGLFEKNEIKWFSYNDLCKDRNKFRLFYRPIVDIIINEYDKLLVKSKQLKYEL